MNFPRVAPDPTLRVIAATHTVRETTRESVINEWRAAVSRFYSVGFFCSQF